MQITTFKKMHLKCRLQNVGHFVNASRPRQDGRYLTDPIFKRIFSNENV